MGNSAARFSLGPAGMALNGIWIALMRIWASHGILNVRMSYLKLHLELNTERLIFWRNPGGCFWTNLNEKEINLEEIKFRRNLCPFFHFVLHFLLFSEVLLQTTILPCAWQLWAVSHSWMQLHLGSISHPLSHSYGIGNVCGCTPFLTAPKMPAISWVRRLNQGKGKKEE